METTKNNIQETSLNRILNHHYKDGFIIVTSYRDENSDEVNKKNFEELKNLVKTAKFSFIPVWGGFIENIGTENAKEVHEPALFIPNQIIATSRTLETTDNLKKLGLILVKKFNQDSFLFKPKDNDNKSYYITKDDTIDTTFNSNSVNDLTNKYFTRLNKQSDNKTDKRFTFTEELYIHPSPTQRYKNHTQKIIKSAISRYGENFYTVDENTKVIELAEDLTIALFSKPLNESSISRIYDHILKYECAIITAFRGSFNTFENKGRNSILGAVLHKLGYGVTDVKGSYIENYNTDLAKEVKEDSFFVVNRNNDTNFVNNIIKLGKKYDQDCVIIIEKGGNNSYLYGTNDTGFPGLDVKLDQGSFKPKQEGEFMTKIGGQPFKFSTYENLERMGKMAVTSMSRKIIEDLEK